MSLSDRCKILLITEKELVAVEVFRSVNNWNACRDECEYFCVKYFAQCKAFERKLLISSEHNNNNSEDTYDNED